MRPNFIHNINKSKAYKIVSVLFFVTIFSVHLLVQYKLIKYYPLTYDDSYNFSVSKNLAGGLGYATSYDQIIQFNPEVTTGPTLIIPGGVFVWLLGNEYYTPGITIFFITNLLLSILIFMGRKNIYERLLKMSLFVLLFLVYLHEISVSTGTTPVKFLGEIPAALCLLIGFELVAKRNLNKILLAGVFLALAVYAKFVAILVLPAFVFVIIIHLKSEGVKKLLIAVVVFLTPLICTTILYQILQTIVNNNVSDGMEFISNTGSGISQILGADDKVALIEHNFSRNSLLLMNFFHGITGFSVLLLILLVLWYKSVKGKEVKKEDKLILWGLSFGIFLTFCWWLLFSPGGILRHALIAILLIFFVISNYGYSRIVLVRILFLAFVLISLTPNRNISAIAKINPALVDTKPVVSVDYSLRLYEQVPRLQSTIATKEFIENAKGEQTGVEFLGCGWWANRDLEYLLEEELNFKDCRNITLSEAKNAIYYLVRSEYWNWSGDPEFEAFRSACEQNIVFQSYPFVVSKCPM